jgi:hypothetical protein
LTVGSEDGFREGEHVAGKLKPLNVERETRPGKYPLGKSPHSVPQDIGRGAEHLGQEIGKVGQRIFGW